MPIQNNQKSMEESIPTDFKNLKKKFREPKVSGLFPKVLRFPKRKPYPRVWI
jgi:hypothetical protein